MILKDFHILRPPYETEQKATLDWVVDAHVEAERQSGNPNLEDFREKIREKLWHIGCKPDRIAKRGHILTDHLHRDWDKMEVYRLTESKSGRDLSVRNQYFLEHTDKIFGEYYPEGSSPPGDLIHVSCTGYISPSSAQKIASIRGWGDKTVITHAYHMGCYAAVPAIRMARGFLAAQGEKERSDIVHTEICSLHNNPSNHNTGGLIAQSLFADGFIKYSIARSGEGPHFKILSILEEIIPNSISFMKWDASEWGFEISLGKEIPVLISRALPLFLKRLAEKGGIDLDSLQKNALFAVHPGGPKILVYIQELLKLSERQMSYSFDILKNFGNMSSATLPHIWQAILSDSTAPTGTPIVGLAFGPGLSITGIILEKICGS